MNNRNLYIHTYIGTYAHICVHVRACAHVRVHTHYIYIYIV